MAGVARILHFFKNTFPPELAILSEKKTCQLPVAEVVTDTSFQWT